MNIEDRIEKIITKAIEYYFSGLEAKDAVLKAESDIDNESETR
ncbi:hypothetical protein [Clostridium tertium]